MEVVFQDEYLLAVNKPAGLLVHRSNIDRHETRFAVQMARDLIGQHVYPAHRLDKPTSGVLLFALSSSVARQMMAMFVSGGVEKTYLAIVRGYTDEEGLIDYPLKKQSDKMIDAEVNPDNPAQEAITSYVRLATVDMPYPVGRYASSRYSLLKVWPQTGRRHQIRRHMKHIFHPVIGDTTHGDGKHNQFFREQFGCHRLLLAAVGLSFIHPITGQQLCIRAPLDEAFENILSKLGWDNMLNNYG
jgi:tRNA pseudouridine65 synthase